MQEKEKKILYRRYKEKKIKKERKENWLISMDNFLLI